jgi:fructokinase
MNLVLLGAVLWDVFDDRKLIGGAPFNVAAHAAKLGMDAAFISAVGDDELGREALAQAKKLGLDTRYIRIVGGQPTGTVRVFLDDGQPDYDIHRPAAYDYPEISDADLQQLVAHNPQWLYFGTLELMSPTVMVVLERLLEALPDARRFYDVNLRKESYTPELIERLLGATTVLKLNDDEAKLFADRFGIPDKSEEEFCRALAARFTIESICITRGENGCAIWHGGHFVESSGIAVSVADAVGAGDAFCAALIHGLTMDWELERVAAFANRLGALVAARRGAVPEWTLAEITES